MIPYSAINSPFRSMYQGFPWRNAPDSGFGYTTQKGPFSPAFVIKLIPLKDLSKPADIKYTNFDAFVNNIRHNLRKGDLVKAIKVNKQYNENKNAVVQGRIQDINVDYNHKRVRTFVRDMATNEVHEVYPETIFREGFGVNERRTYVLPLNQIIKS